MLNFCEAFLIGISSSTAAIPWRSSVSIQFLFLLSRWRLGCGCTTGPLTPFPCTGLVTLCRIRCSCEVEVGGLVAVISSQGRSGGALRLECGLRGGILSEVKRPFLRDGLVYKRMPPAESWRQTTGWRCSVKPPSRRAMQAPSRCDPRLPSRCTPLLPSPCNPLVPPAPGHAV